MISHRLWRTVLNANPSIIGRALWLSGSDIIVIGVLSPASISTYRVRHRSNARRTRCGGCSRDKRPSSAGVIAHATSRWCGSPGVGVRDAQAAVDAIRRDCRGSTLPRAERGFRVALLLDEVVASVRKPLAWLSLAAGVTLLVALANLVVLGLGRWSERQVEFTIRGAIGATSWRLRRQIFCESLLIALCGGACGAALASQLVQALRASEAARLPRVDAVQFDTPAFAVTAALVLLDTR